MKNLCGQIMRSLSCPDKVPVSILLKPIAIQRIFTKRTRIINRDYLQRLTALKIYSLEDEEKARLLSLAKKFWFFSLSSMFLIEKIDRSSGITLKLPPENYIVLRENFGYRDTPSPNNFQAALNEHQDKLPDEQTTQSRQRRAVTSSTFIFGTREDKLWKTI